MEKINITGVPETMLQTLYARAAYSQRPDHKFYDAKAIKIVSRIPNADEICSSRLAVA